MSEVERKDVAAVLHRDSTRTTRTCSRCLGIADAVMPLLAAERAAGAAEVVARVEALCADPWRGDGNWNAVHHTGVYRRGALRKGEFVAVDDLRAVLADIGGKPFPPDVTSEEKP